MTYDKNSKEYLGQERDMSANIVDGFSDGENIHLVYNLGTPEQFSTQTEIKKIRGNLDSYMWTPYGLFVAGMSTLSDY